MGDRRDVRRRPAVLTGALMVAALAACGGGGGDSSPTTAAEASTLQRADAALATLHSGSITLTIGAKGTSADGPTTDPVGFSLDGTFDMAAPGAYPVLDLTYSRLVGATTEVVTVRSDGSTVEVEADGDVTTVPRDAATALEKSDDPRAGVTGDLGIGGWIDDPVERPGPPTDGVETIDVAGPADVVDVLADLAHLVRELTGDSRVPTLEGDSGARIRALSRTSTATVTVGKDDSIPRRVHATLDFAAATSSELADALGELSGVVLELDLVISKPNQPVAPPGMAAGVGG